MSTAEAYGGITPRERRNDIEPCNLAEAVARPVEKWARLIVNDFEATVFAKHPRLAAIKQTLYDAGALYAAMSGSGSTIYGIFEAGANVDLNLNCNIYSFNL